MKNNRPVFYCKECEHLKRVPSLFEDIEILECSKGIHDTINIVAVGGGCTRRTSPQWCPLKRELKEGKV